MKKPYYATHVTFSSAITGTLRYINTDYYCRASINFIAAMCFCSAFFAVFLLFGNDPKPFLLPIVMLMAIGGAFTIFLLGRVMMMGHRVCRGIVVEAEVKKLMLFGHVFYDFEKVIEIVNEFNKKGLGSSIRVKAIQIQYRNKGQAANKTCYFYNQRYAYMTPVVKERVPILISKDANDRFLVFPELLGFLISVDSF
jgi:hypothetical protein